MDTSLAAPLPGIIQYGSALPSFAPPPIMSSPFVFQAKPIFWTSIASLRNVRGIKNSATLV